MKLFWLTVFLAAAVALFAAITTLFQWLLGNLFKPGGVRNLLAPATLVTPAGFLLGWNPQSDHGPLALGKEWSAPDRALTLHQGHRFPADGKAAWITAGREHLRSKFIRACDRRGTALETAGEFDAAVDCYLRGLEVDELAGLLHQGLLRSYGAMARCDDPNRFHPRIITNQAGPLTPRLRWRREIPPN